jgi:hypothetical protein
MDTTAAAAPHGLDGAEQPQSRLRPGDLRHDEVIHHREQNQHAETAAQPRQQSDVSHELVQGPVGDPDR